MQSRAAADSEPGNLGEEEGDDTVADVPADQATGVDDEWSGRAHEPPASRK